jgi:hypothetical protein
LFSSTSNTIITLSLPMTWTAHYYNGSDQIGTTQRWAYTFGPILLAAEVRLQFPLFLM